MKKTLITIAIAVFGVIVLAMPALAVTTVSFLPASISTTSGKTFNVTISVNPQSVANYTEKIELTYPADILEVRTFNFSSSWMPLAQSGYDLIDNASGKLIKTAGYPGGLSSSAIFGTVSFYVKKTGNAVIKLGSNSLALDANNQNVLSGIPEVSVVVSAPAIVPVAPGTPAAEQPVTEQPTAEEPTTQPVAQAPQPTLLAAMGVILTLGTGNLWLGILVGLVILTVVIYVIYLLRKKKNSGNI